MVLEVRTLVTVCTKESLQGFLGISVDCNVLCHNGVVSGSKGSGVEVFCSEQGIKQVHKEFLGLKMGFDLTRCFNLFLLL